MTAPYRLAVGLIIYEKKGYIMSCERITLISINVASIWVEAAWFNILNDQASRWGWVVLFGCLIASERLKKQGQEK